MEEKREIYRTTDFYTTAVLILKKFKIEKVTTKEGRVKTFHFENTDELQETIMEYANGDLEGNIRDFRNAIENVKDMVHSS
jgi:hypothetical protein